MRKTKKSKIDETHDRKINNDLDFFGLKLIKVIGIVGAAIGLVILGAFWYWVIKMLFKVGA
jgi:hypothetical protein